MPRKRNNSIVGDVCAFPGCGRPYHANGLCSTHNGQRRAGGQLRPIVDRSGASQIEIFADHAEIILTGRYGAERGRAIIDLDDVAVISGHRWVAHVLKWTTYVRGYPIGRRAAGMVYLHQLLLEPPPGLEVDHWDGNGLNNRRANLQAVSRRLNTHNQRIVSRNKTGVRGVCWDKDKGSWHAQVCHGGKTYSLGYFTSFEDAAKIATETRERLFENFQDRSRAAVGLR